MSEMSPDELVATKKLYGIKPSEQEEVLAILEYWKNIYKIPLFEFDKVRHYIEKGE